MKKWLWIGGSVGVLALVGIFLYYRSRQKVQQGLDYDLAGGIYSTMQTAGAPAPGAVQNTGNFPPYAMDSQTEPAKSLIAQRREALLLSADAMNKIRSRIGMGTNLFNGVPTFQREKIENAFVKVFNINPDSLLSYPLWTQDKSQDLIFELGDRSGEMPKTAWDVDFKWASKNQDWFYKVPAWLNIDFRAYGFNPLLASDFSGLKQFYKNAFLEIQRLEEAVTYEAAQALRREGLKLSDFGDV